VERTRICTRVHILSVCSVVSIVTIILILSAISNHIIIAQTTNTSNFSLPEKRDNLRISGLYHDPNTGMQLQFPAGWVGVKLYDYQQNGSAQPKIKVSPLGIDPLTGQVKDGNTLESVAITLSTQNTSELLLPWKQMKKYIPPSVFSSATPYLNLMKWGAEQGFGCKVLSQSFTKIKNINSLEEIMQCPGDRKNVSYSFATENYILGVLFDGPTEAVDRNMQKFKTSIDSIDMEMPVDINNIIAGFNLQIKGWNIPQPIIVPLNFLELVSVL
jgi:hypothetical protein